MANIDNFPARMIALLAAQFQDNTALPSLTNLQKLLTAVGWSANDLQMQIENVEYQRAISTAVGLQLDGLGQIVGIARLPNQLDPQYRDAILFQIEANRSSGTPEDVISALKFLTDADRIWYFDQFPAGYLLATDGFVFPPNPSDLVQAIQNLSPAGVAIDAIIAINIGQTTEIIPFAFAGDPDTVPLFVAPQPFSGVQLETNLGDFIYVTPFYGSPTFGGWFAEYGFPNFDDTGSGQMVEALQINGNLPLGY